VLFTAYGAPAWAACSTAVPPAQLAACVVASLNTAEAQLRVLHAELLRKDQQIAALQQTVDQLDVPLLHDLGQYLGVDPATNTIVISGANLYVQSGSGSTEGPINGVGNLIIGYGEEDAVDIQTGSHNLVVGPWHTWSSYGGMVVGYDNTISAPFATVSGGDHNVARADGASISGGSYGVAAGLLSSVSGGQHNTASSAYSHVSGGRYGEASGDFSAVLGGEHNVASGPWSTVSGGNYGDASGAQASIAGGNVNRAIGDQSTVCGGSENHAQGVRSSILGGSLNSTGVLAEAATVSGGYSSRADGFYSSIVGGQDNHALGSGSAILGGLSNRVDGEKSTVLGGENNNAHESGSIKPSYADASAVAVIAADYVTAAELFPYAERSWVESGYLPMDSLGDYATQEWVGDRGYLTLDGLHDYLDISGFGHDMDAYPALVLGNADGPTTVSIGYDPAFNIHSGFTGHGNEVLFRNGVEFMTPTADDTAWHLNTLVMRDGRVGVGTERPSEALEVNGNIRLGGNTARITAPGGLCIGNCP
jgi:hypothetical protein